MDVFLPKGFEPGLSRPQLSRPLRSAPLSVTADGVTYPVLRRWATGFAVSLRDVPALDGVVDLFEGAEHVQQCLITRSEVAQGEQIFTVKRSGAVHYAAVSEIDGDLQAAAGR